MRLRASPSAAYAQPDHNINPPILGNFQTPETGEYSVDNDNCSAAVLTDDAIALLEDVNVGQYHEYK